MCPQLKTKTNFYYSLSSFITEKTSHPSQVSFSVNLHPSKSKTEVVKKEGKKEKKEDVAEVGSGRLAFAASARSVKK